MEGVCEARNSFAQRAFPEWFAQVKPQGRERRGLARRLFQPFHANHIVKVISTDDEIHPQSTGRGRGGDSNIGKVTQAIETAQAFAFRGKIKWLSRLKGKRRQLLSDGRTRFVHDANFVHELTFDTR